MAKFQFRLDTILRLREQEREQRKEELAQALAIEEILVREQRRLEFEHQQLKEVLRHQTRDGTLDLDAVLGWRRYEMILAAQREAIARQLEAVRQEIDKRREFVAEADRGVRVLEILRQKQQEQYKKDEGRKEIKQIDEVAGRIVRAEHEA